MPNCLRALTPPPTLAPLASFILLKYLDMITIAVPPALPACLTVATAIAVARLRSHDIFVSNPAAVALAGHLDVLCFDKTGTLTEPGLDLQVGGRCAGLGYLRWLRC